MIYDQVFLRHRVFVQYDAYHLTVPLILNYEVIKDKLVVELKGEGGYYSSKTERDFRLEWYETSITHHPFFLGSLGVKYRFGFGKSKP